MTTGGTTPGPWRLRQLPWRLALAARRGSGPAACTNGPAVEQELHRAASIRAPDALALVRWTQLAPRRIALIACHWVGDTFWASQVVPPLRRRFPDAEILAVTKPFAADLWAGLVPPEAVLPAPQVVSDRRREPVRWGGLLSRARQLSRPRCDLVIDLTGNRYSAIFTFLLRPRCSLGFRGGEFGWLYSHRVEGTERPGRHLSERPFRVIEPLLAGREAPFAYRLPLRPPQPTCPPGQVQAELGLGGRPYYVLAPGAGWPAKQAPAGLFVEVGRRLGQRAGLVIAGASRERELCRSVAGDLSGAVLCVGRPIGQVVALLAEAGGVVCNDSGVGHLAAALGRPTAAIFTGATDPAICGPLGPGAMVKVFGPEGPAEAVASHLTSAGAARPPS